MFKLVIQDKDFRFEGKVNLGNEAPKMDDESLNKAIEEALGRELHFGGFCLEVYNGMLQAKGFEELREGEEVEEKLRGVVEKLNEIGK